MLQLLVLVLPHSNTTFHFFFLSVLFLKNEDVEAQRISRSLGVPHSQMKQDWTGLSWTQPRQSVKGFYCTQPWRRTKPRRYSFVRRMKKNACQVHWFKLKMQQQQQQKTHMHLIFPLGEGIGGKKKHFICDPGERRYEPGTLIKRAE